MWNVGVLKKKRLVLAKNKSWHVIKIKIEPIQIYENSTTPKYGNKRLQGFRPGFGQGNVRDLAGQLKPKALYQKNTSASPMIKLSCGKTQNDTAVS